MIKICTVVGARPQFIKLAVVSRVLRIVACGMIYGDSVAVHQRKFKWQIESVVVKFHAQVCGYSSRVCTLAYRAIAALAYHAENHLVQKAFLVEVLVAEYFMH